MGTLAATTLLITAEHWAPACASGGSEQTGTVIQGLGICDRVSALTLAILVISLAYSALVRQVPTAQKIFLAWRPKLHQTWWPVLAALLAGTLVVAPQAIAASQLSVSQADAAILSAALCLAMAEMADLLLARECRLVWCLTMPLAAGASISTASWIAVSKLGDPWPVLAGHVAAGLLLLLTKTFSFLATKYALTLDNPQVQVGASPPPLP